VSCFDCPNWDYESPYCSSCPDAPLPAQAAIPGAEQLDKAEAENRAALDRSEADWALRSPLPNRARRKAGALPLLDTEEQRDLFEELKR